MPQLVSEQHTPEWHAAHVGRITASNAPACLGLSPWTSRQKAWRIVLGTEPKRENKHMAWGTEFEPKAREAYECESGNLVTETGFWVHDEHDWLGASPDGLIGPEGMVEIKCPGKLPEAVPPHYDVQCRIQLACTGRAWVDFWAWCGEYTFLARVMRDLEIERDLIRRLDEFRRDFVLTGTEPPRKRRAVA